MALHIMEENVNGTMYREILEENEPNQPRNCNWGEDESVSWLIIMVKVLAWS